MKCPNLASLALVAAFFAHIYAMEQPQLLEAFQLVLPLELQMNVMTRMSAQKLQDVIASIARAKRTSKSWRFLFSQKEVLKPLFDGCMLEDYTREQSQAVKDFFVYTFSINPSEGERKFLKALYDGLKLNAEEGLRECISQSYHHCTSRVTIMLIVPFLTARDTLYSILCSISYYINSANENERYQLLSLRDRLITKLRAIEEFVNREKRIWKNHDLRY